MSVLLIEAGEGATFERVLLDVSNAAFDFAFVSGGARLGRNKHDAVVPGERGDLRIEFRMEPIGLAHSGFEVIEDESFEDAAEVPEGVLQSGDEVVCGLAEDGLAVASARVTQDDAKDRLANRITTD